MFRFQNIKSAEKVTGRCIIISYCKGDSLHVLCGCHHKGCLEFLEYIFWVHTYASCSSGTWQYQSHCCFLNVGCWVEISAPSLLDVWLWAGNWTFLSFCFSFFHDFEHEGNNYMRKLLRVLENVCQNIYRCSKSVCCFHLLDGLGKNVYWNCLKNCPGLRKHGVILALLCP